MAYGIKWTRKDYAKLSSAVKKFNKKLNTINKRYLPKEITYSEVKQNITSRRELNRIINSLNRFQKEGAEEIVKLPSGEKITKWERNEISLELRIAKANIKKQMRPYEVEVKGSGGYTKAQMRKC